jgi:hypothetical protein
MRFVIFFFISWNEKTNLQRIKYQTLNPRLSKRTFLGCWCPSNMNRISLGMSYDDLYVPHVIINSFFFNYLNLSSSFEWKLWLTLWQCAQCPPTSFLTHLGSCSCPLVSFLSPQCPLKLFMIPLVTLKRNFFFNYIILQCPCLPPPPLAQKHFLSNPLWCPFIITNHVLGGCTLRCTQNLVTLL